MNENNTNVPKIRFPGFTDAWKQRKAVDIFKTTADKNHPELPVLSATQEYGMILREDTGINISYDRKNKATYKRVLPGQFVIHLRSFQGGFAHSNVEGITSPAYTVMDFVEKEKHYEFFWKYIFSSEKFIKSLEKVTYGIRDGRSISYDDFSTMSFLFPSFGEQKEIGKFFLNFDHLITLHRRKLNHLQDEKKSLLQKMFPKNGADVPEIRFPGFTDAWEQRKLEDVSIRVLGNDGRMDLPTLTISAGSGWLDQRERFSGNIAGKEQKNYTLLSKGELSYNHGNSKIAKYGAVFKLRTYEEALVPRVYHSFRSTEEASPDFIEYMFATKLPDRELAKLITSGARMDGLLNINYDEFMSINITLPKIKEQIQIGKFFRNLDHLITLHQRKLNHLQEQKKSLLQQMFI